MPVLCRLHDLNLWKQNWGYTFLGTTLIFFWILVGPTLAAIGIPVFIIDARRWPRTRRKLKNMIKLDMRTKINSLAEQLSISEKDVLRAIYELRSDGHPITIDQSTSEVIYNPALLPPSTKIKNPTIDWGSYEKITVILAIVSIVVSILLWRL